MSSMAQYNPTAWAASLKLFSDADLLDRLWVLHSIEADEMEPAEKMLLTYVRYEMAERGMPFDSCAMDSPRCDCNVSRFSTRQLRPVTDHWVGE